MTREQVYEAVMAQLTRLNAAPLSLGVKEISRDFKHWEDAKQQPAVYLVPETETSQQDVPGMPLKWTIQSKIWVYARKTSTRLGVQRVNDILDGIETVLHSPSAMTPGHANTLGGKVVNCAIKGPVNIIGGYLGDQAVAEVPIEIITA